MQHLEVSGAVRHIYIYIYIYVIRRLKVNESFFLITRHFSFNFSYTCYLCIKSRNPKINKNAENATRDVVHGLYKRILPFKNAVKV